VSLDIALTEGAGTLIVHRVDCPDARLEAALGRPVVSMFGCERLPTEYPLHTCLGHQGLHDQGDQSRPDATK
jgi:hypothetical protein